jgi:hypothetical protein
MPRHAYLSLTHMEDIAFDYGAITWRWEPDGIEAEDKTEED